MPKLLLAIQEDPSFPPPYRFLAACYAHMGRLDDAREIVARLRAITPVVIPDASFLAEPRAPRAVPVGPAPGGGRGDMSQTRRLAAILAADVAGYSRLMGADEEGTLRRCTCQCDISDTTLKHEWLIWVVGRHWIVKWPYYCATL